MKTNLLKSITLILCSLPLFATAQINLIKMGTGSTTGAYYPVGGALCRYVKDAGESYSKNVCLVESTAGSVENIVRLQNGELDLGIVQSDILVEAYKNNKNSDGSQLKTLFSLHDETFTIVAAKNANIKSFADLEGTIVNLGDVNSGSYSNMQKLLKTIGLTSSFFAETTNLSPSEALEALCIGKISASVYVIGHPNNNIREALTRCGANLVALPKKYIEKMVNTYPYYVDSRIPANAYPGHPAVNTFGLKAVLVGTDKLESENVYNTLRISFSNINGLQEVHATLGSLDPVEMSEHNFGVPFHAGALKYYNENQMKEVAYPAN